MKHKEMQLKEQQEAHLKAIIKYDNEVHINLDQKEIRDFFAKALYNTFWNRKFRNNETERRRDELLKFKSFDYTIECAKLEIEIQEAEIESAQKKKVLLMLLDERGWEEFDVCESVKKSQVDSWMSFIGTQEEYDALVEILKPTE